MKKTHAILSIALLLLSSATSYAEQDDRTPKEKYIGSLYYANLTCGLQFKLAQAGGEGDLYKCVSESKISIKKAYEAFSKSVKKQSAKVALKEHYITGLSALKGIEPQSDERVINYEKRQGDNKNKLDEMWIRFEAEN